MDFEDFHPDIKELITKNKNITYTPDYNIKLKTYMKLKDRFSVAGVQYSDYQKIKGTMKIGAKINARLEPNNPHDSGAIALYYQQWRIGYIPKGNLKTALHKQRALGVKFTFTLTAINLSNPTWGRFTVEVTGDKDPNTIQAKEDGSMDFNSAVYDQGYPSN